MGDQIFIHEFLTITLGSAGCEQVEGFLGLSLNKWLVVLIVHVG